MSIFYKEWEIIRHTDTRYTIRGEVGEWTTEQEAKDYIDIGLVCKRP